MKIILSVSRGLLLAGGSRSVLAVLIIGWQSGGAADAWALSADQASSPQVNASAGTQRDTEIPRGRRKNVQDEQDSMLIVTGSHIRGAGASAGSPVISIDREEIDRSGYASTQQIFETLPQNFAGGVSEDTLSGADGIRNPSYNSGINLRGLGSVGTLVLLNGRRMSGATSDGLTPDISLIPTSAIERIEVLPDGASAVYGSDAVAGVVNFILRTDYEGAETRLRYGTVTEGSLDEVQASQTFGFNWNGGNLLTSGEYYRRGNLPLSDRSFSESGDLRSRGGSDWRSITSVPGNILDPSGSTVLYAIPRNQDGRNLTLADLRPASEANMFNSNAYMDVLPRQRRYSAFANIRQEVSSGIELFLEGFYANRKYRTRFPTVGLSVLVPATNPFYVDAYGDGSPVWVAYRFQNDREQQYNQGRLKMHQLVGGADVNLGRDWNLRVHAFHSENKDKTSDNLLDFAALDAALADSNPDTALNVFGGGGGNNPETIAKIFSHETTSRYHRKYRSIQAIADGPLMAVYGGEVKVAAGAERNIARFSRSSTDGDLLHSRRRVHAAFAELYVPFVGPENEISGIRDLNLSFSLRHEQYKDRQMEPVAARKESVETTNPKIGINWSVNSDIALRGSFGTAFRAPSLTQVAAEKNGTFQFEPDPRSPGGFTRIVMLYGTRPDLKNEKARTWTVGANLTPGFAPTLRAEITYYRIKFRNRIVNFDSFYDMLSNSEDYPGYAIANPTAEDLAEACSGLNINYIPPEMCTSPDAVDIILDLRTSNRAVTKTDGLDFTASYGWEAGKIGEFNFNFNANYIFSFKQSPTSSAKPLSVLNTRENPIDLKIRSSISWNYRDAFNVILFGNYTDSYRDPLSQPPRKIRSHFTMDLTLSLMPGEISSAPLLSGTRVSLSALNIFDKSPPFLDDFFGYDMSNGDPLGRFVSLTLTKQW